MDPLTESFFANLAADLTVQLLNAVGRRLRQQFEPAPRQAALRAAVTAALSAAAAQLKWDETHGAAVEQELLNVFAEFLARPAVVDELSKLLETQKPDVIALRQEFIRAGYAPNALLGVRFEAVLNALFEAFVHAALKDEVLGNQLSRENLRAIAQSLSLSHQRLTEINTHQAHIAADTQSLVNLQAQANLTLKDQATSLEQLYPLFEQIAGAVSWVKDAGQPILAALRELLPKLRAEIEQRAAQAENLPVLEARYREHLQRWLGKLQFVGLGGGVRAVTLPLEKLYVALQGVAEVPERAESFSAEERRLLLRGAGSDEERRELGRQLDTLWRERLNRQAPERKPVADVLYGTEGRAVVVLGDPGSGKSTLLHILALAHATNNAQALLSAPATFAHHLPIFAPLAAYDDMRRADAQLTLEAFLAQYYATRRGLPGLGPLFAKALAEGRALLLLDGLDEVLDRTTRGFVAAQAQRLIEQWTPQGSRVVVTSRIVGYREAALPGTLPHLTLLDFGQTEIAAFARQWTLAYESFALSLPETAPEVVSGAARAADELLADVEQHPSVARLAANPLMLTMLALLRRQLGMRLPHRRIELYEKYVGAALESWLEGRSPGERTAALPFVGRREAESILMPLALWLQTAKPSGTAGKAEIQRELERIYLELEDYPDRHTAPRKALADAEAKAERFLREMRELAGLIIERGQDAYGFLHLTFQEYFAGRALARLSHAQRWEALRPHLHNPRWREPLLLCAGQLGVVESRRDEVTALTRAIFTLEDDTEPVLHRNLRLALAIAGDDVGLERGLVNELAEAALACLPTRVDVLNKELVGALGQLVANDTIPIEKLNPLWTCEDEEFLETVIQILGQYAKAPQVCGMLLWQAKDESKNIRAAAVQALRKTTPQNPLVRAAVEGALDDSAANVRSAAVRVLAKQVMEDSILQKRLIKMLEEDKNWQVRYSIVHALTKHPLEARAALIDCLSDENINIRFQATEVLGALLGQEASIQTVFLTKLAAEKHGRYAEFLVKGIKQAPVLRPTLLAYLNHEDSELRCAMVEAFGSMAAEDAEVRAGLLMRLEDEKEEVRQAAANALASLVAKDPEVRKELLARLEDEDSDVRLAATKALADLAANDLEVRSRLLARLEDEFDYIKQAAITALSPCIAMPEVENALFKPLRHREWYTRQMATQAISQTRSVDTHLATLQAVLDSDAALEEASACNASLLSALGMMASEAAQIKPLLLKYIDSEDSKLQHGAINGLKALAAQPEFCTIILGRLDDKNYTVRATAARVLAGAVHDETVRSALLAHLNDEESDVRAAAIEALAGAVHDEVVRSALLAYLNDENGYIRATAARALAGAVHDETGRSALLAYLNDENGYVRAVAIEALDRGVHDEAVRSAILAYLNDEKGYVRATAARALAGAVHDETVRSALLAHLNDEESDVRVAAIGALAGAVHDKTVCLMLFSHLQGSLSSPELRVAALRALAPLAKIKPEVEDAIQQGLTNPAFDVRLAARALVLPEVTHVLAQEWHKWLTVDAEINEDVKSFRLALAARIGPTLPHNPELLDWVLGLLRSPRASARLGGALALLHWPGGLAENKPEYLEAVLATLDDDRDLISYPARLAAARALLNRDPAEAYNDPAVRVALEALDYGTQPWEEIYFRMQMSANSFSLRESRDIRKEAALLLGQLDPLRYDALAAQVYVRLQRVLAEDDDPEVRDAAFQAMERLAGVREVSD